MISHSYFKNLFIDTFGSNAYILEICGIYFFCFFFINLVINLRVMVYRHLKIYHLTGASLRFGKTLLSASYNLFLISILTSISNPQAPLLEPEPTPATTEDEIRDPVDENKKKEEHLYPMFNHPPIALSPV